MRSEARECAFKIIFASLFNEREDKTLCRRVYDSAALDDAGKEYADRLVSCVREHGDKLHAELDSCSIGFSEKRMFPADKALLLMALAEIRYFDDVPNVVAIDEAVGLAKRYSTEKSAGFVNGVLAALIGGENR